MECPTIKVKSNVDWTPCFTINEADFDPEIHVKWTDGSDTPVKAPAEAPAEAPAPKRSRK